MEMKSVAGGRDQATTMLRVVALVNNEIGRHGLGAMLRSLPGVGEACVVGTPAQASKLHQEKEVDVLVVSSEGLETTTAAQLTKSAHDRGTKVLLLLQANHEETLEFATTVESNGFLIQEELTGYALEQALARIVAGEVPMPAVLANRLLARAREERYKSHSPSMSLTPRERQALELLVEGLSNKQIARRLQISHHGAKRLVANVLAKLNCPNRTLAVAVALRDGILQEEGGRRVQQSDRGFSAS